ncbi:hypothetical protein [Arsenophonus endosymbiont of Aleurodicus dispersus]|nr:hypothetical protein [Arsenophonus endosymbiont of Aleurodicus dispersus]
MGGPAGKVKLLKVSNKIIGVGETGKLMIDVIKNKEADTIKLSNINEHFV